MQPPHIRGWRKSTNTQQATDIPPALDLPSDIRELLTSATSKVLWQATLIPFEQSRRKAWEPHRITLRAPAAHLSLKIVFSEHCLSQTIIFHANPSPLFTQPGSLLCLLDRTGAGEQDDYLSQGHLVSQGHPSQQWQHDPFSSAIWLGWNKGSPKLPGSQLGVDSWLLLLGGFYGGNLLCWGFDPDTGDSREPLWIPLREIQEHLSIFMALCALKCSRSTLLQDFTALRGALLTGQVNYCSYKNILLVKQREQQAWIWA